PARGRGRPGGRTAVQEQKRRQTRAAILEATGEVFAATPYVYATIDDIIRAAGVSRATFYMHFESKLALALAIYDGITVDWMELFDRLPPVATDDHRELTAWLKALAALYVDHGYVTALVGQLEVFEPSFRQRLHNDRDALIDRLGVAGVGGFVGAAGKGEAALLQRARARLLLRRIDQVCSDLSLPKVLSTAEADTYVRLTVEEMGQFMGGLP
ncbi:MAG: TetR/AcrR family transcriptional regulator, partial [Sphingopyxis sp.]